MGGPVGQCVWWWDSHLYRLLLWLFWEVPLPPPLGPLPFWCQVLPNAVLGVCITFGLPGPMELGLLITLAPASLRHPESRLRPGSPPPRSLP